MKIIKKAASLILAITLILSLSVAVSAAGYSYYAVSGVVNDDGTAIIERAEIVDGIEDAAGSGGSDYVIVAEDYDFNTLDSKAFSVKFTGYPDGIGTVKTVPFIVLIPYRDNIYSFSLRDVNNNILSEIEINNALDASDFTVKETSDSFNLSWKGAKGLTYDITAVSEKTSLRKVLMYRSGETKLDIPFEWLEPSDSVVFELSAQSGNGTVVLYSDVFNTPEGVAAVIADADGGEWETYADNSGRNRDGGEELSGSDTDALIKTIAIVGGVIVLVIIIAVVIIVSAIKKKKN
ncbi:MAG: hypothetical protein LBL98_00080 [Ruminococcus sp.]|nr:hypothetical protein [Ruminococcus sp.]